MECKICKKNFKIEESIRIYGNVPSDNGCCSAECYSEKFLLAQTQPHIIIANKAYFEVGCKNCGKSENWKIYLSDDHKFAFRCKCGNTTELNKTKIQDKPNEKSIPIFMVS